MIRITDRSAGEYEEDELADNSYDEKRLLRAEQRAGRKAIAAAVKCKRKKDFIKKDWSFNLSLSQVSQLVVSRPCSCHLQLLPVVQGLGAYVVVGHFRNTCPFVQNNVTNNWSKVPA